MTIPAHVAGGFLVLEIIDKINPELGLKEPKIFLLGILGSILLDLDVFFYKEIKDHHNSLAHTPLFWMSIFALSFFGGSFTKNSSIINITLALFLGVFSHFLLDFIGARRSGLRIFYPLSKKMYSLFPLDPGKWRSHLRIFPQRKHWEIYLKNKFLVLVEVLIVLAAFSVWISERMKIL